MTRMNYYLIGFIKYHCFNVHLLQNTTKNWEATRTDNNRPHGEVNRVAHVQSQVINIHEFIYIYIECNNVDANLILTWFLSNKVHHSWDYDIFLLILTTWTAQTYTILYCDRSKRHMYASRERGIPIRKRGGSKSFSRSTHSFIYREHPGLFHRYADQ